MVEEALTAFCIGQEGTHVTRPMPAAIAAASLAGGRAVMKDQCAAAAEAAVRSLAARPELAPVVSTFAIPSTVLCLVTAVAFLVRDLAADGRAIEP